MFGLEERARAVESYSTTAMTTAQVAEHPGHPTGQRPQRWLAADPRQAGHTAQPIIALETRRKAIEPVPDGMRQKQAAGELGVGIGAVHAWVRAYREGGMAAPQSKNRNASRQPALVLSSVNVGDDTGVPRGRIGEPESGNALMREAASVAEERPRRQPGAPVEPGEDQAGRPAAPDVFTALFGPQADDSLERLPLSSRQGR